MSKVAVTSLAHGTRIFDFSHFETLFDCATVWNAIHNEKVHFMRIQPYDVKVCAYDFVSWPGDLSEITHIQIN